MKFFIKHKAVSIVLALLIVIICAVFGVGFHYLNKIDFDKDGKEVVATVAEDEGDIDRNKLSADEKAALSEADNDINKNLDDGKIWYSDSVMNVLLLGVDYGAPSYPYGRSDSMILVSVNKNTKKVKLISLSRATYAAIDGYENTRLSHAHGYGGAALAVATVQKNYKIRIDNYISVTFDTFKRMIDTLGGVDITLTQAEANALKGKITANGLTYKGASTYKLNGNLALEYVRLRKIDTDRDRTGRQRKVLTALASKAKSANLTTLNSLVNNILPLIKTDLSKMDIIKQLGNVSAYLSQPMQQEIIPHISTPLTRIGGFDVLLIKWNEEIKYLHDLIYDGVQAQTMQPA